MRSSLYGVTMITTTANDLKSTEKEEEQTIITNPVNVNRVTFPMNTLKQ